MGKSQGSLSAEFPAQDSSADARCRGPVGAGGSFALTREFRETVLHLRSRTFVLHGDRKSCTRAARLDPYYLTLAHDLNGTNHSASVQRHNEIYGAMLGNGRSR